MVSFIVVSTDKKKRETYLQTFAKEQGIDTFDITIIEKDTSDKKISQSIGIEDVKQMQKKIFLKPIKSKNKAVVIEEAHLLTPEAQNALLKVLEEPPANTLILLNTNTKEALLPTIISRCQVIELESEPMKLKDKDREELQTFLANLPDMTIGEKLKQAEKLAKDKDKAVVWIEKVILVAREQLISIVIPDSDQESSTNQTSLFTSHFSLLTSFQSLHTILKTTNVNVRFAIEHTLLSL